MKSRLLPALSMGATAALITVSLVNTAISQEGKPPEVARGKEVAKVAAVSAAKKEVKPFTLECKGGGCSVDPDDLDGDGVVELVWSDATSLVWTLHDVDGAMMNRTASVKAGNCAGYIVTFDLADFVRASIAA